jgi:hypothetical protein
MVGIGTLIMLGIVGGSICFSMYWFLDERFVNVIEESGGSVTVGGVEFYVNHIGNYEILEKNKEYAEIEKTQAAKGIATSEMAEGVYFQIQITAHNIGTETVRFTGGQFHLYDIDNTKYDAVHIGYDTSEGTEELSVVDLLPDGFITVTTQFDIPYDDEMKYSIGIIPDRFGLQDSQERGFICIKNC